LSSSQQDSKPGNPVFLAHSANTSPTLTSWPSDFAAPIACVYAVGTGKAAMLPTIIPKSRLVRWLSASIGQLYRASLTNLSSGFTSRCCKLVSDLFPIFFGAQIRLDHGAETVPVVGKRRLRKFDASPAVSRALVRKRHLSFRTEKIPIQRRFPV
jgi:hypothetical protein